MSQHHEKLNRRAWALARFLCFDRDGFRCTECFRAGALEAHHLIPVSRGGRLYDVRNLSTKCRTCHLRITARANRRVLGPKAAAWKAYIDKEFCGTSAGLSAHIGA